MANLGVILVMAAILVVPVRSFTTTIEKKLRDDLHNNISMDASVRPSGVTNIFMSFQLTSINFVNIKAQQFSVSGWWSMRWTDERLSWTPAAYDNIPVLQIFEDDIWTPTLVVDNSVNDLSAIDEDTIPLRIHNTGTVTWNPPGLHTVSCEMDITYFPFDTQECILQITSFGYTIEELDIYKYEDGVILTYFQPDGEWDLLGYSTDRTVISEGIFRYARVSYHFNIERKPLYYGLNMILPVLINALLSIFVFLLPAESGEKIGYCLTVLLAFMVILTLIATDLPTTSKYTAVLEIYIAIVLIMGGLSVVLSIFVLEIYFRPEDKPVPGYVIKLTSLGMRFCCYESCCARRVQPEEERAGKRTNNPSSAISSNEGDIGSYLAKYIHYGHTAHTEPNMRHKSSGNHGSLVDVLDAESDPSQNANHPNGGLVKKQWQRKQSEFGLRPLTPLASSVEQLHGGEITWKTVSIVMDGVLLRVYALFFTISTIIFLSIMMGGN